MLNRSLYAGISCVYSLVLCAGFAQGQTFPSKPIRVVTGSAGGSSDNVIRPIAIALSSSLGQQVIVDNRPAVMQTEIVSKAAADGHTLLATSATLWLLPYMRDNVPYDPIRDFSPVTLINRLVNVVVVHPSAAAGSIKELIALAREKPGQLNYASAGTGTVAHLSAELFKTMAGVNIVHVPYKGAGPALVALIGGQVQLSFSSASSVMSHIKSGKLRGLAITSAQPSALAPGLPPVASSVPGYELVGITALFAPAKTPVAVIRQLNQEMVRYLTQPDTKERYLSGGSEVVASSPEELAATMKAEMNRLGKVIRDAGITAE